MNKEQWYVDIQKIHVIKARGGGGGEKGEGGGEGRRGGGDIIHPK